MTVRVDLSTPVVVRRRGRRFYQAGALLCLIAAAQAVVLPAVGAGPWWLWPAAPVLLAGAVLFFVKSLPFEHVRFRSARPRS